MKIGFDAKRAFLNESGLGNYARSIIHGLESYGPSDLELLLFTPLKNDRLKPDKARTIVPGALADTFGKPGRSLWRTFGLTRLSKKFDLDVYHGLSHELPVAFGKTGPARVVTIHDCIFMREPHLYPAIDRYTYRRKWQYACKTADEILAISNQTKQDIVDFFQVDPARIKVHYQSLAGAFFTDEDTSGDDAVTAKYKLPLDFLLYVGTLNRRKNIVAVLKALGKLNRSDIPFVIVGRWDSRYRSEISEEVAKLNGGQHVYFIHTASDNELRALYRKARLTVYPSLFEGFGLPVAESLALGTPVLTSDVGCFREAGGDGAAYVNPTDPGEIADTLRSLWFDDSRLLRLAETGLNHVQQFHPRSTTQKLLNIYDVVGKKKIQ